MEISNPLDRIGELIRTQDNRITDQPMFVVQQKRRIWGSDTDGNYVWKDEEWEDVDEAKAAELDEAADLGEPTKGFTKAYYQDIWEFVTACFTEQGCKDYIARNGHNLKEPRIYAEGSYRNEEWRAVRNFLAAQGAPQEREALDLDGAHRSGFDAQGAYMTINDQVPVWDAINAYMLACGGSPNKGGVPREKAVAHVNRAIDSMLTRRLRSQGRSA